MISESSESRIGPAAATKTSWWTFSTKIRWSSRCSWPSSRRNHASLSAPTNSTTTCMISKGQNSGRSWKCAVFGWARTQEQSTIKLSSLRTWVQRPTNFTLQVSPCQCWCRYLSYRQFIWARISHQLLERFDDWSSQEWLQLQLSQLFYQFIYIFFEVQLQCLIETAKFYCLDGSKKGNLYMLSTTLIIYRWTPSIII